MINLLRLLQLFIDFLKSHKVLRSTIITLFTLLFSVSGWLYAGVSLFPEWWWDHFHLESHTAPGFLQTLAAVSGVVLALCALSFTKLSIDIGGIELELEPIRKERLEIRQRIEHGRSAANVLSTIELGLNQITEYYTINKSQARKSFSFSVFAVIMGLITLIGGTWLFYFGKTPNIGLAALSGIGGLLLQFIGGASFYIYNKSLAQLNYFYDKLVRMQDTMLSIQLCNQLEDKSRQNKIREQLILEILTRQGISISSDESLISLTETRRKRSKTKKDTAFSEEKAQSAIGNA